MDTPAGYIVSWNVPQTVDLGELRDALVAAGLPRDMAPDLKPASLVARTSGYIAKLTTTEEAKKLSRPAGHAARQLTREEHAIGTNDLTYTKEASVSLASDGITLQCDDAAIALMLPTSSSTVYNTRTASDVTRIVQAVVASAGSDLIPVREQGGAYFIPAGHSVIDQVSRLLRGIGGELSTFACTIGHGTDASVANCITDYMLKQIAELQEAIAELNEKGIRADVKTRRLARVAELRERVGAYASLVGASAAKLNTAIDVAEASLLAKLSAEHEDVAA